jgi:hypothetical protein
MACLRPPEAEKQQRRDRGECHCCTVCDQSLLCVLQVVVWFAIFTIRESVLRGTMAGRPTHSDVLQSDIHVLTTTTTTTRATQTEMGEIGLAFVPHEGGGGQLGQRQRNRPGGKGLFVCENMFNAVSKSVSSEYIQTTLRCSNVLARVYRFCGTFYSSIRHTTTITVDRVLSQPGDTRCDKLQPALKAGIIIHRIGAIWIDTK